MVLPQALARRSHANGPETRWIQPDHDVGPDGESHANDGVYLEITPGRKLVFTDGYTEGWVPNPDAMMTAVITFEPQADGRTLYIARVGHPSLEKKTEHEAMGFHDGWGAVAQQLEALARTL